MFVVKRDGRQERVHFDKITSRIRKLCFGLDERFVDPVLVAQKVIQGIFKGVKTSQLDELAADIAASMLPDHPHYGDLAGRIALSNLQKHTQAEFSKVTESLFRHVDLATNEAVPLVTQEYYEFVQTHAEALDAALVHTRDFDFDFFSYKTLARSYLMKIRDQIVERPQHLWMRVACALHLNNLAAALETYDYLSRKMFVHASPTLFHAGLPRGQLASCFLVAMKDDSLEGIYDTLKSCALLSKNAGGIGLHVHNIRATGSAIRGTGGKSNGLCPMLRIWNASSRYVDQGGGRRKGTIAIYLEPWHADIVKVLAMKRNNGADETLARDLYLGLWVPDLFMRRVESNGSWSLFCPKDAPGLADVWGEQFDALYESYEARAGLARETMPARDLWRTILHVQSESGMPYLMYKDSCNAKSNQKNLGTIRGSNLCTEIVEFSSPQETAVCFLASISLPMFVRDEGPSFDFQELFKVAKIVTRNLNRVIDVTYYPIAEAELSSRRHRAIGIGVQGLADAFPKMGFPFDSDAARKLNLEIFETLYFGACTASMELAREFGPYETYAGSPMSRGLFQFDLWNSPPQLSGRWDWEALRRDILAHGMRNSLLIAPMPTASTSQILGNNECFEPYTANLFKRRTMAGEFVCVSKHLVLDLVKRGLWNTAMKQTLIAHDGSVQAIEEIPSEVRELHKTVWEIRPKVLIDLAADRAAFVCQSQSLNLYMEEISHKKLTSMHFYAWKKGLKTGIYYLRSRSAVDAVKVTVAPTVVSQAQQKRKQQELTNADDSNDPACKRGCVSCSG